jgi:uracil phosphoribosyltransferase
MHDRLYESVNYTPCELKHRYGSNVHILSDPFLLTHLARLCSPETHQPFINELVEEIYYGLIKVILNKEFPRRQVVIPTRMAQSHPEEGCYRGEIIDPEQSAVSVNLARAGTFPSHLCYSALNYALNPKSVRQDHISASRETDGSHKVVGTSVSGQKIGGSVKGAIVIFPDPMGATGGTIVSALDIYKKSVEGPAKKYIAVHLIVTPEYLKRVTKTHPDLVVYAVRLDRGLSPQDVLAAEPGLHWDRERGLNDQQYIVPGGGGFGEILNNAYV